MKYPWLRDDKNKKPWNINSIIYFLPIYMTIYVSHENYLQLWLNDLTFQYWSKWLCRVFPTDKELQFLSSKCGWLVTYSVELKLYIENYLIWIILLSFVSNIVIGQILSVIFPWKDWHRWRHVILDNAERHLNLYAVAILFFIFSL